MPHIASLIDPLVVGLLRLRNRHFFVLDVLALLVTPSVAMILRMESIEGVQIYEGSLVVVTLSFLLLKLAIFRKLGLYNRYWKYAGIDELAKITLAVIGAVIIQAVLFFYVLRPLGLISPRFPRSVPFIEGLLALLAIGGLRYSVRLAQRLQQQVRVNGQNRRVLVVGAGEAGILIVEEMRSNPQLGLHPVAFIDDDGEKQQVRIRGLDVRGRRKDIPRIVRELDVELIVIAIPGASGEEIRDIASICTATGVETKTVPGVYELLDGQITVRKLRDVQVEDLLRRAPVETDTTKVAAQLREATVLVTGAGGSIGAELCRQILPLRPAHVVLVGHGETSIFHIEAELRTWLQEHPDAASVQLRSVIADIRDRDRMTHVFGLFQPDVVFHAAAHKHVPLMESNLEDAVTNNVVGTRVLLELSETYRVPRFVLISTDKAVNPTSIMGATKRVAELLVQEAALRTGQAFAAVRFGNVLGSRGSVLQVFRRQLERGGPLTVTHPDIKRYFMTIPEAVHLVLQAATMAQGGELFLLDMGEPTKIVDLARDLIRLSSRTNSHEVEVVFTGLRPGEKLHEELVGDGETFGATEHEKILVCTRQNNDYPVSPQLRLQVTALAEAARRGDPEQLTVLLSELVPTYTGSLSDPSLSTVSDRLAS